MNYNYNTEPVVNTTGGTGKLRVRVDLGNAASPAGGARVRVTDPENGRTEEELVTDGEGLTPEIELAAPPYEYSQEYGNPRPFNQYDLEVELEGTDGALIENVQIYPDAAAEQRVTLSPRSPDEVVIPYPALWGDFPPKIPEAEVKPLPFPDGTAVLPEPVVPSVIIVHAGRPSDSSAPNYTVNFRDYIANVASSEIYATWPRETIKANVYAILSFTLNRVYTEWYRSRGYGFTITNSTAYDQSFTYGRTLYKEITSVVNEIFTTYISRPGLNQPLFTQYCDGRRVNRAGWLSQWGSKELGDRGFSALNILKNYYGGNIVLRQAARVEGVPFSYPGLLTRGSRGRGVRTLQDQLNVVSRSYPSIARLSVDGIFGPATERSVREFQRIFGLSVDGKVGPATWYELSRVYTAVAGLA